MRLGKKHQTKHDEAYWDNLRKQFLSSTHERRGAFSDKVLPNSTRNFLEKNKA